MGQLSDAIREHLELKRQHGAAEEEISHQEAEALGPVRREPEAVAPAAEGDRPSSAFEAETALIGSEELHEEPIKTEEPEPLGYESLEEEPADYRAERRDPEPLEEPEPFGYAEGDEPEVGHEPGVGEFAEEEPLDDDVASVFPEPDPTVPDERMSVEDPPPIGPRPLVDEAPVVHGEPLADDEDEDEDDLRLPGSPLGREPEVDPLEEPVLFPADPIETTDGVTAEPIATTDGLEAESTPEPELLSDQATEAPAEPAAFGPGPEPVSPTEPDPFATQPHAVPELEDEPFEDERPALLDEDELEVFEEARDEPPAGADVTDFEEDETEEPVLAEDIAGSLAYDDAGDDLIEDDAIVDDADFRPEEEPPRSSLAPPPRDSSGFDFDA